MIAFIVTLAMGLYAIASALECAERSQRRHDRRANYLSSATSLTRLKE